MKPCGFDIYLKYECDCGTEHWLTREEVNDRYVLVCDYCNKRHDVQPVDNVKVLVNFKKCNKQTTKIANLVPKSANFIDSAYRVLKNYSYTREEIEKSNIEATTTEDFIKKFLATRKMNS